MTDASYRGKRAFDLAVLVVAALPAAFLAVLAALAVRLTSRGPVLFRQERTGHLGRPFEVLKFRTMIDAPEGNPLFPDADRITRVGGVLRRLSLDELPQLWNVARGEMSIVGPRPTLPYQVERYDDRQRRRLAVRPGLTGLAQVNGRNSIAWGERIDLDLDYVDRNSVRVDLHLLIATVPTILAGGGVEGHPSDDPLARPDEPHDGVS